MEEDYQNLLDTESESGKVVPDTFRIKQKEERMLVALWILNGLLALVFAAAGLMKLARPKDALASSSMAWVEDFTTTQVKLIGAVELLGAVGLILPLLLDIAPVLTPIAAVGLTVTMLVATTVHIRRKETPLPPVVLAVLAIVSAILGFIVVL
jgi:uncharacterized membrane protein YphA (DoxX/SURF4 family)